MAKPRIFVSSTYFDLRSVRDDMKRQLEFQGYEIVIHERGDVPYAADHSLEDNCYREIGNCDILVSIIGGRFGSEAANSGYSISQTELRIAIELHKQVYIYIDDAVYHEHRTYLKNVGNEEIKYSSVDDPKIFKFIDEIYALRQNNSAIAFRVSQDIVDHLKLQLNGLFQRLLAERSQVVQSRLIQDLRASTDTLAKLISTAGEQQQIRDENVQYIRLMNHPLFKRLRTLLRTSYRVFFTNLSECNAWLNTFTFQPVPERLWTDATFREWKRHPGGAILRIPVFLFDEAGSLKVVDESTWKPEVVYIEDPEDEGEIPF